MTNINHSLSVQFAEFLFSQNIAKISTKVNFLLYAEQYYMLSLPANFPRVDKKIFKVYFNFSYVHQNFKANLEWDCGNKFFLIPVPLQILQTKHWFLKIGLVELRRGY